MSRNDALSGASSRRKFLKTSGPLVVGGQIGLVGCLGDGGPGGEGTDEPTGQDETDEPTGQDETETETTAPRTELSTEELIEQASPPDTIRVTNFPVSAIVSIYYALEKGFFEDHGIPVTLTEDPIYGGSRCITATVEGDAEIAQATPPGPLNLAGNRDTFMKLVTAPAVVDVPAGKPGPSPLITSEDSGVEEIADLEGETVAGISGGPGLMELTVRWLIEDAGLDPYNDIDFRVISLENITGAVARQDVAAGLSVEPRIVQANKQEGISLRRLAFQGQWLNPSIISAQWTTTEFAEQYPDTVHLFQRAVNTAVADMKENEEEFASIIARPEYLDTNEDSVLEMFEQGYFGVLPESLADGQPYESLDTIRELLNSYFDEIDNQIDVNELLLPWNQQT